MRRLTITSADFTDLTARAGQGDDTVFVALRSGRATGWYGPLPEPVARAAQVLAPALDGADATDHQAVHARLTAAAARTRAGSWAAGALDCAAWDLHARAEHRPVAALLTDHPPRDRIPAYASWLTRDLSDPATLDHIATVRAQGWAFTKWGLRHRPGTGGRALAARVNAAAAVCGPLAADAVGTWPAGLQAAFRAAVDPAALIWLEDPAPAHEARLYRLLDGLPLAMGERLTLADDTRAVLAAIRPSALTLDIVGCGGLTAALRLLDATTLPLFPHGRSLQPGLHLAAAHPDRVPAVEYRLAWEPGRQRLYTHPAEPDHGHLPLPPAPGLGAAPRSRP
ncbi:enolase C-terminal domain-like protein [Streptomyces sp. NPDC058757]|uniref:enolase C-terminal domain-like protein n=1 Tax=Streptomyces sp. NPDC058757 TaxID=3346626 RepID=UPI00367EB394